MTALQFADSTWIVAVLAIVMAALSSDIRVFRYCLGLTTLWLIAVLALAMVRG